MKIITQGRERPRIEEESLETGSQEAETIREAICLGVNESLPTSSFERHQRDSYISFTSSPPVRVSIC